jgi:hypothetical protein
MAIRKVSGKIVRECDESPLRGTLVEVWDRDFVRDDLVGSSLSDDKGNFEITYDTADAGDTPDLSIKVIRLSPAGEKVVIEYEDGPRNVEADYHFPPIKIAGWEYDSKIGVPLVYSDGAGITASPQNFELPQIAKIAKQGLRKTIARELAENKSTYKAQQKYFEPSEVLTTERNANGSLRSDEFFVDSVLNGFNPAKLSFNAAAETYHVRYNIDQYEVDDKHQSPSAELTLSKNEEGELEPRSIAYRVRKVNSNPATFGAWTTTSPSDGTTKWEKAKEYFRIAEFIDGQVKGHLARGHLNTGQYAIALYRNLQKSPILKLLHPHLKSVSAINTFGKNIIFGNSGILVTSPLNEKSLVECMRDDLGGCDWSDWSPRKPVSEQHSYARIQKLYWDVLTKHVEKFVAEHIEKITKDWKEIYFFSQDLVGHSVPFRSETLPAGEQWLDHNEVSADRDAAILSISPITNKKTKPTRADIERLVQACRYAIYHATMWHDWRNDNQRNYGGEVSYARLSLKPSMDESAFQLFIVNLLVDIKYGYIVKDEDGEIPHSLIYLLREASPDFLGEQYDVRDLRSRINI